MPTLSLVPKAWVEAGGHLHPASQSQSQVQVNPEQTSVRTDGATTGTQSGPQENSIANNGKLLSSKSKTKKAPFIDLDGVPAQPLILKNGLSHTDYKDNSRRRPIKEGSSKYTGVYRDSNNKGFWKAQIMAEGSVRSIGYYKTEEEAAADYARAAFKYKPKRKHGQMNGGLDLSGVPPQPLIRNQSIASGFKGVKIMNDRFQARLTIEKGSKPTTLGTYDTAEEAAGIYARAVYCVNQRKKSKSNCAIG